MADILAKIAAHKREEIAQAKQRISLIELEKRAKLAAPIRDFISRLRDSQKQGKIGLIAEIKKASPSKGLIRADFDPAVLAEAYEQGGAACLSVLTDAYFFQGANEYLQEARAACTLPVLRKDFMLEPYQIVQSRAIGADCILIIMAMVDDAQAGDLYQAAQAWQMDALVEVHDEQELERALKLGAQMIGINNRNLRDFSVDLGTSERLGARIPSGKLVVSESGFGKAADLARLRAHNISTFLIGETFMRERDVAKTVRDLLQHTEAL